VPGALAGQMTLTTIAEHTATAQIATFSDSNTNETAGAFTATINWGDGTPTTTGRAEEGRGGITGSGAEMSGDEGSPTASVVLTRTVGGAIATASGTVTVTEADVLTPSGQTISATASQAFSGQVATFSDSDTVTGAGDFTASINWGDGTPTTTG